MTDWLSSPILRHVDAYDLRAQHFHSKFLADLQFINTNKLIRYNYLSSLIILQPPIFIVHHS